MTTINLSHSTNELRVNGRLTVFPVRITEVRNVKPGKWEGIANGTPFQIEGGKDAGGRATDWFLNWDGVLNWYKCNSAAEAIKTIENC